MAKVEVSLFQCLVQKTRVSQMEKLVVLMIERTKQLLVDVMVAGLLRLSSGY